MSEPPPDNRTADAAKMAGGSGITLAGIVTDRGLRWGVSWLLATLFGPEIQGFYAFTVKALALQIASFGSLGLDTGMVYFGARHRKAGDHERLKGVLILGGLMATASSILTAALVWLMPWWMCAISPSLQPKISKGICLCFKC